MIGFLTMPRRLGVVLECFRGVLGEVWRHVGVSGKRRGEFFALLRDFEAYLLGFLAVSRRVGSGLEAFWKRRGSILEASWGVHKEVFQVLKAI